MAKDAKKVDSRPLCSACKGVGMAGERSCDKCNGSGRKGSK